MLSPGEILNPKAEGRQKLEIRRPKNPSLTRIWGFGFPLAMLSRRRNRSGFEFSDFGFGLLLAYDS